MCVDGLYNLVEMGVGLIVNRNALNFNLRVLAVERDGIDAHMPIRVHLGNLPQHQRSACVGFAVRQQVDDLQIGLRERHLFMKYKINFIRISKI